MQTFKNTIWIYCSVIVVIGFLGEAQAQTAQNSPESQSLAIDQIFQCGQIKSNRRRLECFDDALSSIKSSFNNTKAVTEKLNAEVSARATTTERDVSLESGQQVSAELGVEYDEDNSDFGEEHLPSTLEGKKANKKETVTLKAIAFRKSPRGIIIVTLENGQIWQQLSADPGRPRLPRKESMTKVTLRRASMGSYFMRIGDVRPAIRVKRLK